jgi:hypothetical protein
MAACSGSVTAVLIHYYYTRTWSISKFMEVLHF